MKWNLNKGMFLETVINHANKYYLNNNIALVSKINVNINLVKIEDKQITKANFSQNFNCDYIGLFQGTYLEFEAKETYKDHFSFINLKKHQEEKLVSVTQNFGLGFVIIYFHNFDQYFCVNILKLVWQAKENKKIPYLWFKENAIEIFMKNGLLLDYLSGVSRLINCI
ncbi:Holliday junction-specific endonuclease [Spiroplasma sabaudiense Ar-1343]|uniref:Holliday junction resolvase RecU n=1 Tax=Spiroplasma sabaudiense Ar-1343 TaxID=1276257 RepID=W6AIY3_9MOLU|nr:Holliday junction resolvase RecU [Spiroplasma sabaudiense]AHI53669.1 Holliday junction-specific endonuclease [Spiroplasma sabaudiense Ar-1343]